MKYLLTDGDHDSVLFVGYSFSDVYDIIKSMNEISENKKEFDQSSLKKIFIIMHTENDENFGIYSNSPDMIRLNGIKSIYQYNKHAKKLNKREIEFDRFEILLLKYDTSKFWENLSIKLGVTWKDYSYHDTDVKCKINNWVQKKLSFYDFYYILIIAWRFNYEAGQEYCFLKNNDEKEARIKEKALEKAFDLSEKLITKSNTDYLELINKTHKVVTLAAQGKFPEADLQFEKLFNEVDELDECNGYRICNCCG